MPEFARRNIFYGFFEIVDDIEFTTFPHFGALK